MIPTFIPLQHNLAKLHLYMGREDGLPGPLSVDALACAVAPSPPPLTGRALFAAIPSDWWTMPNRVAMLFAMIHAETGFRLLIENLNYDADGLCKTWPSRFGKGKADPTVYAHNPQQIANLCYSGRDGNVLPTDGWTFRGRAWPQLTGRANYKAMSAVAGLDLTADPDALLAVDVAAKVTVAFFLANCRLADADAGNVAAVRHQWNGGANGLQDALDTYDKIKLLWGQPS